MFPEPVELLLIGCLTELIWTPKLKSSSVHFWKSYICSHKLDVEETNFSLTQFDGI